MITENITLDIVDRKLIKVIEQLAVVPDLCAGYSGYQSVPVSEMGLNRAFIGLDCALN